MANLSRSILFREYDEGKQKAKLVAARAKEINPEINIQYFHGDVTSELGLGVFRKMDVIIGCLDSILARYILKEVIGEEDPQAEEIAPKEENKNLSKIEAMSEDEVESMIERRLAKLEERLK